MKTAILTGGTGFLGFWLLKELVENNVFVHVIARRNSKRLDRLKELTGINIIELDMDEIANLPSLVSSADVFYHLAWEGARNDFPVQARNIRYTVQAMEAAGKIGVRQFIVTGSQAEYGVCHEKISEGTPTNPDTAYGVCKLAASRILSVQSQQLGLPVTWVRVFSVYGEGDNPNTLISYLIKCFEDNVTPQLTSGKHLWDFLYAGDAANALYLLGRNNITGTYNLAHGESRPLREFVMEVRDLLYPGAYLHFESELPYNGAVLDADVDKIKKELGWMPHTRFSAGIPHIIKHANLAHGVNVREDKLIESVEPRR